MDRLKTPDTLNMNASNLADEWKRWQEELQLYIDLAMKGETDSQKVKMFLYLVGAQGREMYKTMTFSTPETERKLSEIVKEFASYCNPKRNETVERFNFFTRNQSSDENIDKYATELKVLAATCDFKDLHDSLIRDRIVCGIGDSNLRERLLREADLNLAKCLQICRASELSKEQIKKLESPSGATSVHAVKNVRGFKQKHPQYVRPSASATSYKNHYTSNGNKTLDYIQCKFCGKSHERKIEKCPAYGQTCDFCKKKNHFETVCLSKRRSRHEVQRSHPVHALDYEFEESEDDEFLYINSIMLTSTINKVTNENKQQQLFSTMNVICGESFKPIKFQLDSGATCNVISAQALQDTSYKLRKTDQVLRMYNQTTIQPLGISCLKLVNPKNGKKYKADFVVVDSANPLLGCSAVQQMDLLSVNYENIQIVNNPLNTAKSTLTKDKILTEYAHVFEGTGHLKGDHHMEIDETVTPVVHPPRKVPVALKEKLKDELDHLEGMGIIKSVSEPTPWVSSLVTVLKPSGKLRICIDPKDLNRAIRRSHYPLLTIEEILPDLSRAKVFSTVDMKNGFWHVSLDEESSLLTTFNTPFGRFRWLRLPFGISSSPEVFQRYQNQAVEGLPGVKSVHDDILIYGEGDSLEEAIIDHDEKFRNFMQRCMEKNIKLNADKLKYKRTEVPFIGHLLTNEGLKPDPEKVRAVADMPNPTDVAGVRRFIGFVNYLSKFLPKLSHMCEPLRKLVQNSHWYWTDTHEDAIQMIKAAILSSPVLQYYQPQRELTLQCDASERGLGCAALQDGQPVAYASRSLSSIETRYAQIEKELLSIVFGLEKFHQMTYARKVTVQTDHKPLESILKKPLHSAPKRLQRMLMRLQSCDITLVYRPGRDMHLADTLSRAYLQNEQSNQESEIESVNALQFLAISNERINDIAQHTDNDVKLQQLKSVIKSGWPEHRKSVSPDLAPYFNIRDELTLQDKIILKGQRIVIPTSLRDDMLQRIHSSHVGIEGCLRRARESIYWPGMNAQIKDYIAKCDTCKSYQSAQQKETLMPHDIPARPWAKIAMDLFHFQDRNYLITVDYFSNFWEIDFLENTRSSTVIQKLRAHFSRYGIPEICISDNGPQFSSDEFRKFAELWNFNHRTSSPGYPQSNGKAEEAVKSAKSLLRKASHSKSDPYLAILDARNTPTQGFSTSPVQRFMSRRTRTLLPTHTKLLEPQPVNKQSLVKDRQSLQQKQAQYYNQTARDLKPLCKGDIVRIAPLTNLTGKKIWTKGVIQNQVDKRSYNVKTQEGSILRRNRRHLRKTNELVSSGLQDDCEYRKSSPEARPTQPPVPTPPQGTIQTRTRTGVSINKPIRFKDYVTS